MTLAIDLINRAFRLIGNNKSGDAGDPSEYIDALESLNDMIADWSLTEGLLQYKQTIVSYAFTASLASITVGPTGNLVTSYTGAIKDPYIRMGSTDYPLIALNAQEYSDISTKILEGGLPKFYFYDASTANSTLYLFPGGSNGQTLYFNAMQPLQTFTGLQNTVLIPSHYNRALVYNLAVEIAPEYGEEASRVVMATAMATKRKIKQMNFKPSIVSSDAAGLNSSRSFDISSGGGGGYVSGNYVITG